MFTKLSDCAFQMSLLADYMPDEYNGDVYHYTSPDGLMSMLLGDREKLTIWASRFDCLNDFSEGTLAELVYGEVCRELHDREDISDDLFAVFSGVKPARTNLYLSKKEKKARFIQADSDRFIVSFSKNPDSLAMWNYYSKGSQYEGFNIGLSPTSISDSLAEAAGIRAEFHIYPVVYHREAQKCLVRALLLNLAAIYDGDNTDLVRGVIANQLNAWELLFKSEYFRHEEEVRVIMDIPKGRSSGAVQPFSVHYRHGNGLIIPYIELKFDKEALCHVSTGPLQCDPRQKEIQREILSEMLASHGYHPTVHCSEIPVRF